MPHITTDLASDWVNFAKASMASRIADTEQVTAKVLKAVQAIATELDDKEQLEALLTIKSDEALSSDVLPMLQDLLKHLSSQDELTQLIAPLYTSLQFEDRTRQKLEGLLGIMSVWADVRNDNSITDEDIATEFMKHVVTAEQQSILATYFPEHIQVEEESDELEFF